MTGSRPRRKPTPHSDTPRDTWRRPGGTARFWKAAIRWRAGGVGLALLALGGCGLSDTPDSDADPWKPKGINDANLATMVQNPADLVRGHGDNKPGPRKLGARAVTDLWTNPTSTLPGDTTTSSGASAGGAGAGGGSAGGGSAGGGAAVSPAGS
jgi:uncharacterized membrane protein YgcG